MALKDIPKFERLNNVSISVYTYQAAGGQEGFIYPLKVSKEVNEQQHIAMHVKGDKVRDHCHFTGQFRGAAHNHCNLRYKIDKQRYKLPIVFHNLCGYDAHLIFQKVKQEHGKINVIPNNSERYISFDVVRLKFLDSMQFLSCGLNKLAEQLSVDQFKHLKTDYPVHWKLLPKKCIYCNNYMNSMERFKEHIFNRYDKHVSEEQYTYAGRVWEALKCNTMKDNHNHHLITDILLLADVFENFRKMSLGKYGLDPIHYYSFPGLSWDPMLAYTGVELELITDPDMHLMVEKSMHGSISNICH